MAGAISVDLIRGILSVFNKQGHDLSTSNSVHCLVIILFIKLTVIFKATVLKSARTNLKRSLRVERREVWKQEVGGSCSLTKEAEGLKE